MKKLILLLLIPLLSFGQNQDSCNYGKISNDNFSYEGCRNYEGKPDGKGILSSSRFIYDGMFKNSKFHGYGLLTFSNGDFYKGNFIENKQHGQGIQTSYFDDQTQVKDGFFKDDNFQDGTMVITYSSGVIDTDEYKDFNVIKSIRKENQALVFEKKGEFFSNGMLKNGSETRYDGNLQTFLEYKNGREVSRSTNIDNLYIKNDILGSENTIEIDLEVEGNTKYVNVNFESEDESYRFVFDTGAESLVIGYLLFEELKSKGLKFEDMGIKKTTLGVSGIPFESNVIKINKISIGSYTVKNVFASVPTIETANSNLLGISFMKKFRDVKWSLNGDKLIFEK